MRRLLDKTLLFYYIFCDIHKKARQSDLLTKKSRNCVNTGQTAIQKMQKCVPQNTFSPKSLHISKKNRTFAAEF